MSNLTVKLNAREAGGRSIDENFITLLLGESVVRVPVDLDTARFVASNLHRTLDVTLTLAVSAEQLPDGEPICPRAWPRCQHGFAGPVFILPLAPEPMRFTLAPACPTPLRTQSFRRRPYRDDDYGYQGFGWEEMQ